ncbi:MAG: hypothetical protein KGH94_03240 [Candidatus Micrarchaeota archaeon]|nr:hypothetical protein [Candidatus Micrarchaeota archaeon]
MPTKLAEKGTEVKLSVDQASREIREDCREIRMKLAILSPILTSKDIAPIEREAVSIIAKKGREYPYYEIGHHFAMQHAVAYVKNKVGLSEEEEGLLTTMIGRVYYNPPPREFIESAKAAEKLDSMGPRGNDIRMALKEAYTNLKEVVEVGRNRGTETDDMFTNPITNRYTTAQSFAVVARSKRNLASDAEGDESLQFYA